MLDDIKLNAIFDNIKLNALYKEIELLYAKKLYIFIKKLNALCEKT